MIEDRLVKSDGEKRRQKEEEEVGKERLPEVKEPGSSKRSVWRSQPPLPSFPQKT